MSCDERGIPEAVHMRLLMMLTEAFCRTPVSSTESELLVEH